MIRSNYHTHCVFCDGKGDPEEYVKRAIGQGMTALGFSCHAPLPFPNAFAMPAENFPAYVSRIKALQQQYRDILPIFLGLEVDFIPGIESFQTTFSSSPALDYTIGSVHYVDLDEEGNPWPIDSDEATFARGIATIFHGEVRPAVERYYALIRQMVEERTHDVVGHLDVIKKYNHQQRYFSEEESWYRAAVEETLAVLAASSMIVEVNTAGLQKPVGEMYPSRAILKRCRELDIRVMINSDAHTPAHLQAHFAEAASLLQEIGYREVYQRTLNGWEAVPLTP
ncbi:MAG: histidinol-phosphatase HisJ [Nitrospinota bacterium]|nr:MAG: histidinol-phosphatase HisJ [Nitrospinota bacterium]